MRGASGAVIQPRPMARRIRPLGTFTPYTFDIPGIATGRRVRLYVPRELPSDGTRPALYMFDGQNDFDDEGSYVGGWFAHDAVDRLSPRTSNVPVVVAIDHGGPARIDELGPWKQGNMGGKADAFLDWVVGTLVPKVRGELNLTSGALGAVVAGSSMGGLAALYAHFRHPDVFGGALSMSPAFWFGRGGILAYVTHQPVPPFSRVYLDCGQREGGGRMAGAVQSMADLLRKRGYGEDRLMVRIDSRGTHHEKHWRRRLPRALRFMFRR